MSRTYDCPNCSGTVTFQSSVTVFAVCPYCRSTVVRRDVNIEAFGKVAELPPDLSPLQIGTHGVFQGRSFTLIGRVRLAYDEGSWNEWCALFENDLWGWLAEAQGLLMMSHEVPVPKNFPASDGLAVGQSCRIDREIFTVVDRKETVCLGSEGELTFAASTGRKALTIDLATRGEQFASAEFFESGTRLFVGRYVRFDDLQLANLRPVPGWSQDAPPKLHATTSMNCPACAAPVELRAAGLSMSAVCASCGAILDTANSALKLINQAGAKEHFKPILPLGQRGTLFGVEYEVIGFQAVADEYCTWFEYLLFNPWRGFDWLVTYEGHWSFVRRLTERPIVAERTVFSTVAHAYFQGEAYRIFAQGQAATKYVLGEFYWKVAVGQPAQVTDFVCPPKILSRETYPELAEETWSQGLYVEPQIIQQAFGLEKPLREPADVYLNQPNPHAEKARQLAWIVPLLAAAALFIQLFSASRAANQEVLHFSSVYRSGLTNPIAVTAPFEIPGGHQAVAFTLQAPVQNSWFELGIDIVRADTGQAVASFEQGVEFYFGEDWGEGGQIKRRIVPHIAPGKYYLTLDAATDPAVNEMPFELRVVRDVTVWSNFWIGLGILLAYPIYRWARSGSFESRRWLQSDFSPYYSSASGADDNDDSSDDDD